ncbi:protein transport protein Sec24A-like isoform X2 [Amphiura filiformis]|uniref:protein transport protein Sec24A-like isoform X2 n=1 Tax=Amphiura filiformis TaxID=82378 RepID=UPI003B215829
MMQNPRAQTPQGGYNAGYNHGMYQQQRPTGPPQQGPPPSAYNSGFQQQRTASPSMGPPQGGPSSQGQMSNKMSANAMGPPMGGRYPPPSGPRGPNQMGAAPPRGPPPPGQMGGYNAQQKGLSNMVPPPGGPPGQYTKPISNSYGHGPPPRISQPTSVGGSGPPPSVGGSGPPPSGPMGPPTGLPQPTPQTMYNRQGPPTGPPPQNSHTDHNHHSEPPSQRSSAAPSPIPSQRYDALEGGTPYKPVFEVGTPTSGNSPSGTPPPPPMAHGTTPGLAGMRAPYPGSMGPPPQGGGMAPPPTSMGPPPRMGVPQGSRIGPPPTGMTGPPPPTGMAGPPPTGMAGPPPTGMAGPPPPGGQSIGSGIAGRRMYPQQPGQQQYPPTSRMDGPPLPNAVPPTSSAGVPPLPGQPNNIHPQGQPMMNNVNAGMGNLRLQQGDTRPVNLLQERHVIPTTPVEPPKTKLNPQFQKQQVDPNVFRSTLSVMPQTQTLLQKSRLPLGLVIHPFKDLSHLPVIQSSVIVRCRSCRTYINPFVTFIDQRRWKCNLCHRINDLPEEFSYDPVTKTYGEPQRRPEIKSATIEFIAPSEYMLRPPQPAVYLFMLDVSFAAVESGYLSVVCQTLIDELTKMPGDARTMISLLTFDNTLHFYSLQEGMSRPQMMVVSDLDDIFLPSPNDLLVNIQECKELLTELLTQLPHMFDGNKNTQTALGPALQAALKLLGPTGGRVTVFQSGLPSAGAGTLKAREDPNQRANSKHIANLGPATDFYKKMALDFSAQQIAVDLFMISSQYTDIATLAGVSKYSGGSIHYYPGFHTTQNTVQVERLSNDFRRYLTRKIGFEAVMRVRCTKGLNIHTFHGNFFVRSTDLLSLPNIGPDSGYAMQLSIDESLHDSSVASFQAALLYTSSKGERRIRVHTMCLPVTNQLSEVMAGADQQGIVCMLSRMAVDKSVMNSVGDARDAIVNVCLDSLSAYKGTLASGQTMGTLMAPHSLRLLPCYMLALLKCAAFRLGSSTRLDERVYAMEMLKCQPLMYIMLKVHPHIYPVHELSDEGSLLISDQAIPQPPIIGLSSEYISRSGAYLMDCGDMMYLFVNREVTPQWCSEVLDVPDFRSIPEGMTELPELPNAMSERTRSFIEWLQDKRAWHAPLQIIREDSKLRMLFLQYLIQDRTESSMSYYEFLQHLQKEIK